MTHDPLCPQQPRDDGATLTLLDGRPVYCACDLIAKVRQDERERAGIEQKTPTAKYPFTTRVRQSTHDHLCPQPVRELSRPGLTVIAGSCHCATIAKVREEEAMARRDELLRQGEERMLRWAIKTVESIGLAETSTGEYLSRRAVLAALRALQP